MEETSDPSLEILTDVEMISVPLALQNGSPMGRLPRIAQPSLPRSQRLFAMKLPLFPLRLKVQTSRPMFLAAIQQFLVPFPVEQNLQPKYYSTHTPGVR